MSGPEVAGWQRWADLTLSAALGAADGGPAATATGAGTGPGTRIDEATRTLVAEVLAPSRFGLLVQRLGLTRPQVQLLALVVAVEIDLGRQQVVTRLNDDPLRPLPTLGLLDRLGLVREAGPDATLVRAELLDVAGTGPWSSRQVAAASRVSWHLLGVDDRDPDLPDEVEVVPGHPVLAGTGELLLVVGADRQSRRQAVAGRIRGRTQLISPVPTDLGAARALVREAVVTGAVVVLELDGVLPGWVRRVVERSPVFWALSSATELVLSSLPRRPWEEIRVPDELAGPADWSQVLGGAWPADHPLDREQLRWVGVAVHGGPPVASGPGRSSPGKSGPVRSEQVTSAVRRLASGQLDQLATRTEPRRGWEDLVLPPDQSTQLRELTARYRHRRTVHDEWGFGASPSRGVVALFAGPSGTGKTLAAEIIAGDLGLDLYRVDLAAVVSKYIGETEKNLDHIFDAARAAAAVLLFDEADALFGRRTEVADAHDRYANIEVSYLLQRLESHDGCVVLTTNLKRNIDAAFTRRLTVTVDFPPPGVELRHTIWQRNLPATAPIGDVDCDFLAERFDVTGGTIRNAAVAAAFLAAERGESIGMIHVVQAMRRELQKAGRLQSETDFGPYRGLVMGHEDRGVDHAQPVG